MPLIRKNSRGFTMLEIVVGIVMLTVGALGYAILTAQLARAFYLNAQRTRAGDLVQSQHEDLLRTGCSRSAAGRADRFGMPVDWTVGSPAAGQRPVTVSVTRAASTGIQSDSLNASLPCI